MARTLLDICQDLSTRIGVKEPTIVINGTQDMRQVMRLLGETARDLIRRHDWEVMERVATFTSTAVELQATITTSWPDFRRMRRRTFINITKTRFMRPIDAAQHAALTLNGTVTDLPYYRIRGNQILFPGNTSSGDSCQFEYITNYWVLDVDGVTYKARPIADTDLLVLDDEALILGTKWRWKKEQGLAYGEDFTDYEKLVQELEGANREHTALPIGLGSRGGILVPEMGGDIFRTDTTELTTDSTLFTVDYQQ